MVPCRMLTAFPRGAALLFLAAGGCCPCNPGGGSGDTGASDVAPGTIVTIENATTKSTTAHLTFGSDSVALPSQEGWSFCATTTQFSCTVVLSPGSKRILPLGGRYLNATVSFDAPATCGNTKAEVNANNPSWYDTTDVSLVDGFSNFIVVDANGTKIVLRGKSGNEDAFGVYPLGCDGCAIRLSPPCGFPAGTSKGCKGGTQFKPDVPCQYQGPSMGGGGFITVSLVEPVPATP